MEMPIIVGVVIAVMGLVTFTGWLYELATGMGQVVLDDAYFNYRILFGSILSIGFMVAVFYAISLVNECPNENREGLFAGLRCEEYLQLKSSANDFFKPQDKAIDETL